MENNSNTQAITDPTPPDCFKLEELRVFKDMEGHTLAEVNYYFWIGQNPSEHRFLAYVELLFANENALILGANEASTHIFVSDAMALITRARELQVQNDGQVSIQRVPAQQSFLWENLIDKPLNSIQLSKTEEGLYQNDALLFDFVPAGSVLLALSERGGLAVQRA